MHSGFTILYAEHQLIWCNLTKKYLGNLILHVSSYFCVIFLFMSKNMAGGWPRTVTCLKVKIDVRKLIKIELYTNNIIYMSD